MKKTLEKRLSKKRYQHSLGVQQTAIKLAKHYHVSVQKASIAGILHDCAKGMNHEDLLNYAQKFDIITDNVSKYQPALLHGSVGAYLAKEEFKVTDHEILEAIFYHTTGKESMSLLEKIIYLADYIEPSREFDGIENLRSLALEDLDKALLWAFDNTIQYVLNKNELLHIRTIEARNFLLLQQK